LTGQYVMNFMRGLQEGDDPRYTKVMLSPITISNNVFVRWWELANTMLRTPLKIGVVNNAMDSMYVFYSLSVV